MHQVTLVKGDQDSYKQETLLVKDLISEHRSAEVQDLEEALKEHFDHRLAAHNFKLEIHYGLRRGDSFVPLKVSHMLDAESGRFKQLYEDEGDQMEVVASEERPMLINFVRPEKVEQHL